MLGTRKAVNRQQISSTIEKYNLEVKKNLCKLIGRCASNPYINVYYKYCDEKVVREKDEEAAEELYVPVVYSYIV